MQTSSAARPFFEFDHPKSWTENSRRRAYALCAATDQEVLAYATSGMRSSAAGVDRSRRSHQVGRAMKPRKTVKYFETEHEEVVADSEAEKSPST